MFEAFVRKFISRFDATLSRHYISEEIVDNVVRRICCPGYALKQIVWAWSRDAIQAERIKVYNAIMGLPDRDAAKFRDELAYLVSKGWAGMGMFPYAPVKEQLPVESGYDNRTGLPYVVHNGHRLYWQKWMSPQEAESVYRGYVENECILGDRYRSKTPHAYFTDSFKVEEGDVLLDVGCSEGLFALHCIDLARRVYAFEALPKWKTPLSCTFGPFAGKAKIYNKYVSDHTGGSCVRLVDVLADEPEDATYFIKMDIEGAERVVLPSCRDFFAKRRVKLACAAYHRVDDAECLSSMLQEMGFSTEFSDGWMLPEINGYVYPYFRHGMIYARNF